MSMDTLQHLAADYVLGTLSAKERAQVQARLPTDAALRKAVQQWEHRLLPIAELAEPVTPAANLWKRIELALPPEQASASAHRRNRAAKGKAAHQATGQGPWWNTLAFWRFGAGASFAAAAFMAIPPLSDLIAPVRPQYIVVLVAPNATAPGWVVETNANKQLKLIPLVQTAVPDQRALQFWTRADGWNAAVSLGLVKSDQSVSLSLAQLPAIQANQLFEITLEPQAGSPTGRPTGPVLYVGRSVKMI